MNLTVYNKAGSLFNSTMQFNTTNNNSLLRGDSSNGIDLMYLHEELLAVDTASKWLLVASIVISLISNSIIVICKWRSPNVNPYQYLILNVAICDLTYTFIQIFQAHRRFNMHVWYFGRFMCKAMSLSPSSLTSSMFTMTFMAIERFTSIVYPFRPRLTKRTVSLVVSILWVAAISLHMPLFLTRDIYVTQSGDTACKHMWPPHSALRKSYFLVSFMVTYPIPLLIIIISFVNILYTVLSRTSKRTILRINVPRGSRARHVNQLARYKKLFITFACILLAFIVTTTPNQALILWINFAPKQHLSFKEVRFTFFMLYTFAPLVHIHSITNPLIYSISDEKFRLEVRQMLRAIWGRLSPQRKHPIQENSRPCTLALNCYESPALLRDSSNNATDDSVKKHFLENQDTLEEQKDNIVTVHVATSAF